MSAEFSPQSSPTHIHSLSHILNHGHHFDLHNSFLKTRLQELSIMYRHFGLIPNGKCSKSCILIWLFFVSEKQRTRVIPSIPAIYFYTQNCSNLSRKLNFYSTIYYEYIVSTLFLLYFSLQILQRLYFSHYCCSSSILLIYCCCSNCSFMSTHVVCVIEVIVCLFKRWIWSIKFLDHTLETIYSKLSTLKSFHLPKSIWDGI